MKIHTTNYYNTFIEIAEDCPAKSGEIPPAKGEKKSVANLQFDMLIERPYQYTSDEVLFSVFASREAIPGNQMDVQRQEFFSKGQPCFRASPLTKRYGWGVHSNEEGKIALYPVNTSPYNNFVKDNSVKKVKAMNSKRR